MGVRFNPELPLVGLVFPSSALVLEVFSVQPHSSQEHLVCLLVLKHKAEPIVVLEHIHVLVVGDARAVRLVFSDLGLLALVVELLEGEHALVEDARVASELVGGCLVVCPCLSYHKDKVLIREQLHLQLLCISVKPLYLQVLHILKRQFLLQYWQLLFWVLSLVAIVYVA